jgi:hypothetical protein
MRSLCAAYDFDCCTAYTHGLCRHVWQAKHKQAAAAFLWAPQLPTRAACARDAAPPSPPAASKLAPSPGELGLTEGAAGRTSTPWQERFVPRPGVACAAATMSISGTADGPGAIAAAAAAPWHPQPPRTYLEALHRQQRLLHGVERRRSLRLHQVRLAALCVWEGGGLRARSMHTYVHAAGPGIVVGASCAHSPVDHLHPTASHAPHLLATTVPRCSYSRLQLQH